MNPIKRLEQAALRSHARGESWASFWQTHSSEIAQAEPYSVARYHRLMRHLLHLVTSGDQSGEQPVGTVSAPWESDDLAKPADVGTRAKIDWSAAGITATTRRGG